MHLSARILSLMAAADSAGGHLWPAILAEASALQRPRPRSQTGLAHLSARQLPLDQVELARVSRGAAVGLRALLVGATLGYQGRESSVLDLIERSMDVISAPIVVQSQAQLTPGQRSAAGSLAAAGLTRLLNASADVARASLAVPAASAPSDPGGLMSLIVAAASIPPQRGLPVSAVRSFRWSRGADLGLTLSRLAFSDVAIGSADPARPLYPSARLVEVPFLPTGAAGYVPAYVDSALIAALAAIPSEATFLEIISRDNIEGRDPIPLFESSLSEDGVTALEANRTRTPRIMGGHVTQVAELVVAPAAGALRALVGGGAVRRMFPPASRVAVPAFMVADSGRSGYIAVHYHSMGTTAPIRELGPGTDALPTVDPEDGLLVALLTAAYASPFDPACAEIIRTTATHAVPALRINLNDSAYVVLFGEAALYAASKFGVPTAERLSRAASDSPARRPREWSL